MSSKKVIFIVIIIVIVVILAAFLIYYFGFSGSTSTLSNTNPPAGSTVGTTTGNTALSSSSGTANLRLGLGSMVNMYNTPVRSLKSFDSAYLTVTDDSLVELGGTISENARFIDLLYRILALTNEPISSYRYDANNEELWATKAGNEYNIIIRGDNRIRVYETSPNTIIITNYMDERLSYSPVNGELQYAKQGVQSDLIPLTFKLLKRATVPSR